MSRDYDFWVYIMRNQHDSVLYIRMTNELSRQITEHRSGDIPGFTTDDRCHELVYHEHHSEDEDAIERENQKKRWSRAKKIDQIERMYPRWLDLANDIF